VSSGVATTTDVTGADAWRARLSGFLLGGRGALAVPIVAGLILLFLPELGGSSYWVHQVELIAIYALVVSGLNLSFGLAGEVQFGQVLMFAIGAYIAGALAERGTTDIVVLMLIGGVIAAIVATVIALPALRIGGWSLAMTSFFLVITIPELTQIFSKYTGGTVGLPVPVPEFLGGQMSTSGFYHLTIIVLAIWMVGYRNLVTSRFGVIFRLLRESPELAGSLGFSTMRLKVLAYALGAFPAGVAGCLFAFQVAYLTPGTFGLALAIGFVAASVLGGVESVYGAILGAAIFQIGPNASLSFQEYAPVAYGVFLIVAAIILPLGLSGLGRSLARNVARRLNPKGAPPLAAAAAGPVAAVDPAAAPSAEERGPTRLEKRDGKRLAVEGVSRSFGGVKAVREVTIAAEPGRVTALIGSNGSGKTTLLNLIGGYSRVDDGQIRLGDADITGFPPHKVARLGVGRTFQTPSVPRGLTVLDVVAAGRYRDEKVGIVGSMLRLPSYWRTRRNDREAALAALRDVGLEHLAGEEASKLSLGTRRLLEVARAICGKVGLILLDEPASGLSDSEVEVLGEVVRAAADAGTTVVLIEHNFRFIVGVSDAIHVLHGVRLLATGTANQIGHDPGVIESYLGSRTAADSMTKAAPAEARPAVEPTDA
jgi:branched-chain amino acid transport system permease protein